MLRLNKRSYKKVGLRTLQNMANSIANEEHKSLNKAYIRACGQGNNDPVKKWIVDIDYTEDLNEGDLVHIKKSINDCMPKEGENKILAVLPTKNVAHLITTPFNIKEFRNKYITIDVDIHKDNPINLFIP